MANVVVALIVNVIMIVLAKNKQKYISLEDFCHLMFFNIGKQPSSATMGAFNIFNSSTFKTSNNNIVQ
jgi:hypothetical protein